VDPAGVPACHLRVLATARLPAGARSSPPQQPAASPTSRSNASTHATHTPAHPSNPQHTQQMMVYYFLSPRVTRDVRYGRKSRQLLDLYIPKNAGPEQLVPVVVFVTGGAWTIGYKAWGVSANVSAAATGLEKAGVCVCDREAAGCPVGAACAVAALCAFCLQLTTVFTPSHHIPSHHITLHHPQAVLARRLCDAGIVVACLDYRNAPQADALQVHSPPHSLRTAASAQLCLSLPLLPLLRTASAPAIFPLPQTPNPSLPSPQPSHSPHPNPPTHPPPDAGGRQHRHRLGHPQGPAPRRRPRRHPPRRPVRGRPAGAAGADQPGGAGGVGGGRAGGGARVAPAGREGVCGGVGGVRSGGPGGAFAQVGVRCAVGVGGVLGGGGGWWLGLGCRERRGFRNAYLRVVWFGSSTFQHQPTTRHTHTHATPTPTAPGAASTATCWTPS